MSIIPWWWTAVCSVMLTHQEIQSMQNKYLQCGTKSTFPTFDQTQQAKAAAVRTCARLTETGLSAACPLGG